MDLTRWLEAAGISRNPFPDAEWIDGSLYVLRVNLEPLTEVIQCVFNREAQIILVKAPYGFGKSAFREAVRSYVANYDGLRVKPIVLLQPEFNELQFYRELARALGIDFKDTSDKIEIRQLLTRKLIGDSYNQHFLFILDDAQPILRIFDELSNVRNVVACRSILVSL